MADVASEAAIILDRQNVQIPFMRGELPGSEPTDNVDNMFAGGMIEPPVDPKSLLKAVATNGALNAVTCAVADGCAGVRYEIEARFNSSMVDDDKFSLDDPKTWTPDIKKQRNRLQVMLQAGFLGRGAKSLRAGFREQELDRVILGWGAVGVMRDPFVSLSRERQTMPTEPRAFTRFEAVSARWSRPSKKATMVPVPIALEDGTIWWIEEPRHFRRLRVQISGGRHRWFKEYGDWRSMDARTGKYSSGNRHKPSVTPGKPGEYKPGKLPKNAVHAGEIMAWRTPFPGMFPYGWSGWHSELKSSAAANEHIDLILAYLKSGLHSVILAAANRPFEANVAQAAVDKIDELGRGRKGLASLITLALVPGDSGGQAAQMPFQEGTADRGRLVLHELTTKLPTELLQQSGLQSSLATRFSEAERIPALLLGRSDNYNFATASAAWTVVNRLRFGPHHEEREAFLDRILIEMGITFWRIKIISPEWDEKEPISGLTSVTGQLGGVSINKAMQLFSDTVGVDFKPIEEWWGEIPMPFATQIISSPDPAKTAAMLGVELPEDALEDSVVTSVMDAVSSLQEQIDRLSSVSTGEDGEEEDEEEDEEDDTNVSDGRGRPLGS